MALRTLLAHVSRIEKWTLTTIVAAALFPLAFAVLADQVVEGATRAFDEHVLLLFRVAGTPSQTVGPPWLKEAMRDITALGSTSVLTIIVASVAGFLFVSRKHRAALMVVVSVVSGVLLSNGLKAGFARARPDLFTQDIPV